MKMGATKRLSMPKSFGGAFAVTTAGAAIGVACAVVVLITFI
jgi:hypothetical protein